MEFVNKSSNNASFSIIGPDHWKIGRKSIAFRKKEEEKSIDAAIGETLRWMRIQNHVL